VLGGGGEREHVVPAAQPARDQRAEDRPLRRPLPLAVNDPHAHRPFVPRHPIEKRGEDDGGLTGTQAVEIDFGHDRVTTAAQPLEDTTLKARSGELRFFARRRIRPAVRRAFETFDEDTSPFAVAHACDGFWRRRPGGLGRGRKRTDVAHRVAKHSALVFRRRGRGAARGHDTRSKDSFIVYDDAKFDPQQPIRCPAMRILLSNDDGCHAPGLEALAEGLADLAEIVVVAPDRNRSGASNSLTLDVPLRVRTQSPNRHCVNGTPTDCVHLALTGFLSEEPDVVVSGVNDGANLGDDVLYSGTVAAAMEGRTLGYPAIAVSLLDGEDRPYATAVRVVRDLLVRLPHAGLPPFTVLNVNVPARPYEALSGFRATRLGSRHRASGAVADRDPRGRRIYWVGSAGEAADAGEGTDFEAVQQGFVSVTPLQVDLTRYAAMPLLERWLASAPFRD
jgi:5'-nucleotidase